jgi:1-pyrroline-5-carboxylate dehydrogenase
MGGNYDKSKGTLLNLQLLTTNPKYATMETELFGPVVIMYTKMPNGRRLWLVDTTSEYALTGVF